MDVSIDAFNEFSLTENNIPQINNRNILLACCELALKYLNISSFHEKSFAMMILGGNATSIQDNQYDIEFIGYFTQNGEILINYYLPSVLGVLTAITDNVDPWCATNILGGYAATGLMELEIPPRIQTPGYY